MFARLGIIKVARMIATMTERRGRRGGDKWIFIRAISGKLRRGKFHSSGLSPRMTTRSRHPTSLWLWRGNAFTLLSVNPDNEIHEQVTAFNAGANVPREATSWSAINFKRNCCSLRMQRRCDSTQRSPLIGLVSNSGMLQYRKLVNSHTRIRTVKRLFISRARGKSHTLLLFSTHTHELRACLAALVTWICVSSVIDWSRGSMKQQARRMRNSRECTNSPGDLITNVGGIRADIEPYQIIARGFPGLSAQSRCDFFVL